MKRLLPILLLLVLPTLSFSTVVFADGNELITNCNQAVKFMDDPEGDIDRFAAISCLNLVTGVLFSTRVYSEAMLKENIAASPFILCIPEGVNTGQASRVVVKYLADHPEDLHEDEELLVLLALIFAFKCN